MFGKKSATEIKSGLDSKWGLTKRQQACEYAKACREIYQSTKVVRSPLYVFQNRTHQSPP